MHVAVIIVGFRNEHDVRRCLDAIERTTHRNFEIVICENGGPEAGRRLMRFLPDRLSGGQPIRLIQADSNLGYAGGANTGIRASPGADAYWILNPDTEPHPDALSALLERLDAGDCDMVGGVLHDEYDHIQTLGGRWRPWLGRTEALFKGAALTNIPLQSEVERLIDYPSGASMLISRHFVDVVGLMREDFFLYCEEVEWSLRARDKGLRIGFAPNALVLHRQGSSTGSARGIRDRPRLPIYLDERNKILISKDRHASRLLLSAPAAVILLAGRYLRRGAWRQFGYGFAGWFAGLLGQRGQKGC